MNFKHGVILKFKRLDSSSSGGIYNTEYTDQDYLRFKHAFKDRPIRTVQKYVRNRINNLQPTNRSTIHDSSQSGWHNKGNSKSPASNVKLGLIKDYNHRNVKSELDYTDPISARKRLWESEGSNFNVFTNSIIKERHSSCNSERKLGSKNKFIFGDYSKMSHDSSLRCYFQINKQFSPKFQKKGKISYTPSRIKSLIGI